MIDLYTGTPGSGKSLHIAQKVRKWIKRGYPVIGNFDIKQIRSRGKWGGYYKLDNNRLTPKALIEISDIYYKKRGWKRKKEEQILLVIDECQLLFNSRDWNKPDRKEWLSFFTQHRKLMYHIILCCQFDMMIDKQVRALIEYEYIHRKVSNIGMSGKIISAVTGGNLHVIVQVYKPLNIKVGSEFVRATRDLYSLYDTYNTF